MPEPLSTIGLVGYVALQAFARTGSAISTEADSVRSAAAAVVEAAERSHVLFGDKAEAISQISALVNECAELGWNGDGSLPLDRRAAMLASDLVRALPAGIPLPEFSPEPDGCISLDWILSRNRVFSISAGRNNRLAFAWLDGTDKGHGVARFDLEQVPQRILDGIRAIIGHGNTAIGTR